MPDYNRDLILYASMFNAIKEAIFLAIGNKDKEAFFLLDAFLQERLGENFSHNNLSSFEQLSYLPLWYYDFALDRLKESGTFSDIHKTSLEQATGTYRSVAKYDLTNVIFDETAGIDTKKLANKYFHIIVNRFGDILNTSYKKKDIRSVPQILNSLDSIVRNHSTERDGLNLKYSLLKHASRTEEQETAFKELEYRQELEDYHFRMVRILLKVSCYWFLYLFYTGYFSLDEARQLLNHFKEYRGMLTGDFTNDILFLYQYRQDEYSWERWDVEERLMDKVYTVISPMQWIAIGALQYLLMEKNNFYLLRQEISAERSSDKYDFLENLRSIIQSQVGQDNGKWDGLFGLETGSYDKHLVGLDAQIGQELEIRNIDLRRRIANTPIDPVRADEFLQAIRSGWENGDNIRMIFRHFGKIENVGLQAQAGMLHTIGISNELAIGTKRNLISGADYIPFVGLEKWGISIAGFVALDFFRSILTHGQLIPINNDNVIDEIAKSIDDLATAGAQPTLILLSYNTWKRHFGFNKSQEYEFTGHGDQGLPFENVGGKYRGIPIVYFFDNLLIENKVVIAAFAQSFTLVQESAALDGSDIWHSEIREITNDNIAALSQTVPTLARAPREPEEQLLEILGSVILDSYVKEYFRIDNTESYKVLQIMQA